MRSMEKSARYLPSLNGARALLALLTFLLHLSDYPTMIRIWGSASTELDASIILTRLGGAVTAYFFVLSGFVVTWASPPEDTAVQFWRRRFFRIYPTYFVACLVGVVGLLLQGGLTLNSSIPTFLVIQTYNYNEWMPGLNMPSWSVVCDVLFYLSFPLTLRIIDRVPSSRLWMCAGLIVAAIIAVPFVVGALVSAQPGVPYDPTVSYAQYWLVVTCAPMTLLQCWLGVLIARIVRAGRWIPIRPRWAVCTLLVPCMLIFFVPTIYSLVALWIIPMTLFIGSLAVSDLAGRKHWLNSRFMVWCGDLTLVFYLLHYPVMTVAQDVIGSTSKWPILPGTAVSVLLFAVIVALAWLVRCTVEKPAFRKWARPRQHVRAKPPAVV